MTIHKEGYTSIAVCILFILVLNAFIQFYLPTHIVVKWIIYILSFGLFSAVLLFFRSPIVAVEQGESWILCPADGKVVSMEETIETEILKDKRIKISLFMSPTDVHVTRNPVSGAVKYFKYHSGSSADKENTTIVTENEAGVQILFRQVTGALARQMLWYVKEGDIVAQGEQSGFISSNSHIDLFLPLGTQIMVQIGELVKGGRTVLGKLKTETKVIEKTVAAEPLSKAPALPTMTIEHDVYLAPKKPIVKKPAVIKKATIKKKKGE